MLLVFISAACSTKNPPSMGIDAALEAGATVCDTHPPANLFSGCTITLDQCSDGNVYQVNCPGGMSPCQCRMQIDGGTTDGKQIPANVCTLGGTEALSALNQGCGWNVVAR